MRGGTSNAVVFLTKDLPADKNEWPEIFLKVMGSPDPYGRQLDGMGGGVSSLSKVCVVGPSAREDADVDYTFVQVRIREAVVSFQGNCGNMSSAIGPFAVEAGLVSVSGDMAKVRIHNTNTQKVILSNFEVRDGRPVYSGDLVIPGVSGSGGAIRLDFLDPEGSATGAFLPSSGEVLSNIDVDGHGPIRVSMVDVANPGVFIDPRDIGLSGVELPAELEANERALALLEQIRVAAALRMGTASSEAEARASAVPFIAMITPPQKSLTLTGDTLEVDAVDLTARIMSNGQLHRALPVTACLCTAAAASIPGTIVAEMLTGKMRADGRVRLGMPSGVLEGQADVERDDSGAWRARSASIFRTARKLFDGHVYYIPGQEA